MSWFPERVWRGGRGLSASAPTLGPLTNEKPPCGAVFSTETWSLTVPRLPEHRPQVRAVEEERNRWSCQRSEQVHGAKSTQATHSHPKGLPESEGHRFHKSGSSWSS